VTAGARRFASTSRQTEARAHQGAGLVFSAGEEVFTITFLAERANGRQVASSPKTWNLVLNRASIGRQVHDAPEFWDGAVDDVRLCRRVLPQTDIQATLDGRPVPDYASLSVTP
jgi:hypothetical protein